MHCGYHWWIQGGAAGTCIPPPPPTGSISFLFAYVFAEKCMRRRSAPPSTGNPGSATGYVMNVQHFLQVLDFVTQFVHLNAHLPKFTTVIFSFSLGGQSSISWYLLLQKTTIVIEGPWSIKKLKSKHVLSR